MRALHVLMVATEGLSRHQGLRGWNFGRCRKGGFIAAVNLGFTGGIQASCHGTLNTQTDVSRCM